MNDFQHSKQTVFIRALELASHVQGVNISIASMIFGSARRIEVAALVVVLVLRWDQTSFCSALLAVHALHGSFPFPAHLGAKFDSGTSGCAGRDVRC
jgi:hypothetical protein